jgi:hypothetical protein
VVGDERNWGTWKMTDKVELLEDTMVKINETLKLIHDDLQRIDTKIEKCNWNFGTIARGAKGEFQRK